MNSESTIPNVFILATCRVSELLPAATLVFKTLRVGLPTANVAVFLNDPLHADIIRKEAEGVGCKVFPIAKTIHHVWLETLLDSPATAPLLCLDTDIVFFDKIEDWDFGDAPMAGRYTPAFRCKFANAITTARLHTSCLFVNPVKMREAVAAYLGQFPDTPFTPRPNLVYPSYYPVRDIAKVTTFFSDTMSLMYQAIGGVRFTEQQNEAFEHLHFATISDIVCPYYPENHFRENHFAVFENPKLIKGAWRQQENFYRANAV